MDNEILREIMFCLGTLHRQAHDYRNQKSMILIEYIAAELMAGNNLPYSNIRLALAEYWPTDIANDETSQNCC